MRENGRGAAAFSGGESQRGIYPHLVGLSGVAPSAAGAVRREAFTVRALKPSEYDGKNWLRGRGEDNWRYFLGNG